MEEVLTYSLWPYPHPLATNEGDLVKTVKAKLLKMIEDEIQDGSVDLPVGDKAYIFDAMAILQTLTVLPATFGELAMDLLAKIVNTAVSLNFSLVDFVCDRYPEKASRIWRGTSELWVELMSFVYTASNSKFLVYGLWRKQRRNYEIYLPPLEKCRFTGSERR
ncbi:Hypothetical predicted protein [Paramuricea clavata]|uniref:Uncharacterized protein n=1 Tax=Paramuricea clavata TaxID=317549 RepID=A0A6S7J1N9_PARCT|nr:Hypothetical predicted protein [Paramuricea clavata]